MADSRHITTEYHWAKPGAKCVCVAPGWRNHETGERASGGPKKKEVCTIVSVEAGSDNRTLVRIKGHIGPFRVDGFRPIARRSLKQGIALFAPLLKARMMEVAA